MIIDSHAHVSALAELWACEATRLASRGTHGRGGDEFELFSNRVKTFYFDAVLHTRDAVELPVMTVGPDHCLFGAECAGAGSEIRPHTGRPLDAKAAE